MNPEDYESLIEDLTTDLAKRGAAKIIAEVEARQKAKADNPLLTVQQCADHLGLSHTKTRNLINAGLIKRAPGITDIRVRKSELDKYGTEDSK